MAHGTLRQIQHLRARFALGHPWPESRSVFFKTLLVVKTMFHGDEPVRRILQICEFLNIRGDDFRAIRLAVETITQIVVALKAAQRKTVERHA